MKLLLDTHILIWALNDDPRLSKKARELLLKPENSIYYSVVSIWEVAIKHAIHPENVAFTGRELAQFCNDAGFLPLNMQEKHVFSLETIERENDAPPHNDPFDRILIAQAKTEKMRFLTHDALLPYYKEPCILPV